MKPLTVIVFVIAATLVATALPFLPGPYNVLAVPLCWIARGVGMVSLLLVPIGVVWLFWTRARRPSGRDVATAVTLILVPGVVAGAQLALARPLTSFAWNRTMDGLAPLIADIERYRVTNGHYPRSLFSEWMDYRPNVMGVGGYQYETSGDGFTLAVEVPTFSFDSREYLLYNPADTYVMASHDADLLQRSAAELVHYRGYYSARRLDRPHWAVLSFD